MPYSHQNLLYSLCYSLRLPELIGEHTLSSINYDYSCTSADSFKHKSIILYRDRAAYTHRTHTHTCSGPCWMIVPIKIQQLLHIFNFIRSLTKYCNSNKPQELLKACNVTFINTTHVRCLYILSS